eukprot:9839598-Alexandrium_andersonii.AAC.1
MPNGKYTTTAHAVSSPVKTPNPLDARAPPPGDAPRTAAAHQRLLPQAPEGNSTTEDESRIQLETVVHLCCQVSAGRKATWRDTIAPSTARPTGKGRHLLAEAHSTKAGRNSGV